MRPAVRIPSAPPTRHCEPPVPSRFPPDQFVVQLLLVFPEWPEANRPELIEQMRSRASPSFSLDALEREPVIGIPGDPDHKELLSRRSRDPIKRGDIIAVVRSAIRSRSPRFRRPQEVGPLRCGSGSANHARTPPAHVTRRCLRWQTLTPVQPKGFTPDWISFLALSPLGASWRFLTRVEPRCAERGHFRSQQSSRVDDVVCKSRQAATWRVRLH